MTNYQLAILIGALWLGVGNSDMARGFGVVLMIATVAVYLGTHA